MDSKSKFKLSDIIRESRQRKYKTAKDFWSEHEKVIGSSYPHYAAIETGAKLPDIELAISIAKILKIDLRLICHVWAKDQMPTPETKSFFEPIPGREVHGIPGSAQFDLDDFFVFTERHIQFLTSNKSAWDVASYILAAPNEKNPTLAMIEKSLGLDSETVSNIVDWLRNEGLVLGDKGHLKPRRRYLHLPNTEEFKKIRDNNFLKISQDLISKITPAEIKEKEAYRSTFMRRITRVQAQEISRHLDDVIGHLGNMPDTGNEFYALTVAFGPRAKFSKEI